MIIYILLFLITVLLVYFIIKNKDTFDINNCKSNKLEFIHIPKNAGTSIEKLGKKYNICWGMYNRKNLLINKIVKCNIWHNPHHLYVKDNFAIVRNPYKRIISEFFYQPKWEHGHKYELTIDNFYLWINETFEKYKNDKYIHDCHIIPQSEYIYHNGKKVIENVYKLEDNLNNNLQNLFNKYNLNIDIKDLDKNNVSTNPFTLNDIKNQNILNKIYDFYKVDFDNFGYDKLFL